MTVGLRVKSDGVIESPHFSESGQGQYLFRLRGTGLNHNASKVVTVNGVDQAPTYGRGVALMVFNAHTLAIEHNENYDIYGSDQRRTDLAAKLESLSDDKIFCIVSYDAINTNSNLTNAMAALRSAQWNTVAQTSKIRLPYCCIGIKRIGILAECLINADRSDAPYAELAWSYEGYESAGSIGYGPVVENWSEKAYSGNNYCFLLKDIGLPGDIKVGEYVRFTAEMKIDAVRKAAGGHVRAFLWNDSTGKTWDGHSASVGSYETEWTPVTMYCRASDGAEGTFKGLRLGVYHTPDEINDGTSYVRKIIVQRCGFSPDGATVKPKVSPHQLTGKEFRVTGDKFNVHRDHFIAAGLREID